MQSVTHNGQPVNQKHPDSVRYPPNIKPSDDDKYHIYTTACQYCIVGCGYQVHVWDDKRHSEPQPRDQKKALWISPSMTGNIYHNGQHMKAAVVPDPLCELNHGNHSVRGGTMGRNLVSCGTKSTEDRLKKPQIRINGTLEDFDWDDVIHVMSSLIKKATNYDNLNRKFQSPEGLGVKMYGYQFIENTYAATKLFFFKIKTPNLTQHDRPALADSTPGLTDAGFGPHDFSYNDIKNAEIILIIGSNPYENASVFFMNYMMGKKIICIDPRRHITADYAIKTGGMHLQLKELGTDVVVLYAIVRVILENGWEDCSFIKKYAGNDSDIEFEEITNEKNKRNLRRVRNITTLERSEKNIITFEKFKDKVLNSEDFDLGNAEEISGISADEIKKVAELIAKPRKDSSRPRTSIIFEKGIIWGFNYQNTAAVANLAILIGSVGQFGRVTGRAGGHQKGWVQATNYPEISKERSDIRKNVDEHILNNEIKLYWIVGCNPAGQVNDAQNKWGYIKSRIHQPDSFEKEIRPIRRNIDHIIEKLSERIERSGLVLVQQDIYPNLTTKEADIVLPVAGWGEENFSRWNGERRLRIYEKFQESPSSDCWPDWKIFKEVALAINDDSRSAFGWNNSNEIFEEAANTKDGRKFKEVVEYAKKQNKTGHEQLRKLGTNGIILPAKSICGKLLGTRSLYPKERFKTESDKLYFLTPGWDEIKKYQKKMRPDFEEGELWITNGRFNHTWNTMFTHSRNEYISKRYPADMPGTILEINKKVAEARDLNDGDVVNIVCDKIPCREDNKGGQFKAVVSIQDSLPDTVAFALFSYPHNLEASRKHQQDITNSVSKTDYHFTGQAYANNITTAYVDPVNQIAAFKYARGKIVKTGDVYQVPKGVLEGPVFEHRNRAMNVLNNRKGTTVNDCKQAVPISFSKQILPLISPFSNHHDALSSYESLMETYWVKPGNGAGSELIKRLRGEGVERMPLGGPYFEQETIRMIERWIDEGAKNDEPTNPIPVEKSEVLIIGGGVAGLTAGVELIERGFDVTIVTEGHRLGGKGSSWRDASVDKNATWHDNPGVPEYRNNNPQSRILNPQSKYKGPAIINHGFHGVFGFYHNFIDLLKNVGAKDNLVHKDHAYLVMEENKLHKFQIKNLPFPFHLIKAVCFTGMSLIEKFGFGLWFFNIFRLKPDMIEKYDYHSLASWSRGRGLVDKSLKKNFFRMAQEADFNFPYGFSAYVGLHSYIELVKSYANSKIYYFNGGITKKLMDPIGEYFKKKGGKIVYWQKAVELKHEGNEIKGVVCSEPICHKGLSWKGGEVKTIQKNKKEYQAEYYVSTLPSENFKELNPGDSGLWDKRYKDKNGKERYYFRDIWSFDTIETFAYQIWLNKEVTSRKARNNVIIGLETPFSLVIDYKHIIDEYKENGQIGSVLDMVGSQGFFKHSEKKGVEHGWTVEQIKERALDELVKYKEFRRCRIDRKDPKSKFDKSLIMHEEFHENNSNHNKFFLTLPKSTQYRPETKTPFSNFLLAGDWIKNGHIDLICMEGACISGKLAANEIVKLKNKHYNCSGKNEIHEVKIVPKDDSKPLNIFRGIFSGKFGDFVSIIGLACLGIGEIIVNLFRPNEEDD